ncbi:MAG TPA: ferrochelatase [Thermodesulfobacteriota bacterium]|nr:ferrochelatase [Thermodesulfobacteriota bacterium]
MNHDFDAVLLIGYGGPEAPEEIRPFLRRVAKGRPIPEERLEEVAHHYELIGGRSPLNEYTYKQARALEAALAGNGSALPVYVGMRNWNPFIVDTIKEMSEKGVRKAVGMIMAAHQCDASWERYQKDVEEALAAAGANMEFVYAPPLFDHPLFIEDSADRAAECLAAIPEAERDETMILYSAHSIPAPMAESSPYVEQLTETARLVSERLGHGKWRLVYQSRSGRPQDPWLEPDVCDVIRELAKEGVKNVIVQPIGFLCDHVEVLFDIGVEAKEAADEAGINLLRAKTVNDDPKFISALTEAVEGVLNGRA